jgi:hypothetical protein
LIKGEWVFRIESPDKLSHNDKLNKNICPEKPLSGEFYVSLPGHPLYGQRVQLTHYEPSAIGHWCLIEDPLFPDFHYQIKATWLSPTPPLPISESELKKTSICILLRALDRMVQVLLTHSQNWRASEDGQENSREQRSDLEPASGSEQTDATRTPLLPGVTGSGRHSP